MANKAHNWPGGGKRSHALCLSPCYTQIRQMLVMPTLVFYPAHPALNLPSSSISPHAHWAQARMMVGREERSCYVVARLDLSQGLETYRPFGSGPKHAKCCPRELGNPQQIFFCCRNGKGRPGQACQEIHSRTSGKSRRLCARHD